MLNLANLVEEVQIACCRRIKLKNGDFADGSLTMIELDIEETLKRLVGELKKSPEEVFDALKNRTVDLVFTAHPTQSVHRSLLQKHGRIRNCLTQLYAKDITPDDRQELDEALQRESQSSHSQGRVSDCESRHCASIGSPKARVSTTTATIIIISFSKYDDFGAAAFGFCKFDFLSHGSEPGEIEKEKIKGLQGTNLDGLLQRLPGCVSRDLIDQLTVEFCYLNSKSNRKKLVKALFNVPRTSLELLPYYSHMVATLSTCMKDVSSMLLQLLEEDDQMNIETKIKNIRCLKACLDDFTHHNIDVACNLLETCGRFLYRSPETTVRMANMLEILMRLKNVKNLDPRHSTLVENAYYLCKPPERSARVSKVHPPLHQYIRKLLFSDLDKSSIEHVLRQLRKLPWSECEPYLLKCFMKVHKGKYGQIHLIASLTTGLSRYHDEFAVAVVDEVPYITTTLMDAKLGTEGRKDLFDWLSRQLSGLSMVR
ncbi:unnamed protein product [Camellia sinensis]